MKEGWTHDTPVPPEFFGPLWEGPDRPDWAPPESEAGDEGIELTIDVPDDATDEEVLAAVRELAVAADDMYRAYGGSGLQVADVEITDEVTAPVEAPR